MTKRYDIWLLCTIFSLGAGFLSGCATTHKMTSTGFSGAGMIIDGSDADWPTPLQYYDKSDQAGVRVMNDRKSISICFSADEIKLKKKLMMTGLTFWLDPEGGKNKVFGVHIITRESPRGPLPGREKPDNARVNKKGAPGFEFPNGLDVTYPHTTGPLRMTIAEARNVGIEAVSKAGTDGKIVVEAKIRFDADEVLSQLKPGMEMGIGFETGKMEMPGRMGPSDNGNGMGMPERFGSGPPDGGMEPGMGRGPGGGRPPEMKKEKSWAVWIKVKLADTLSHLNQE